MHDEVIHTDVCAIGAVRRVAAMLDLDPDRVADGDALPRGWHFVLLGGETRRSSLRSDGFPGFGVAMPGLGLPRLVLGGRTVDYRADLIVGASVIRKSCIEDVQRKQTASGEMAIVTIRHELGPTRGTPASIVERQTYLLLGAAKPSGRPAPSSSTPVASRHSKLVVPDETLLFQYSALGFNSHKIHLDRDYARDVEGLPGLVVNGGLTTLLLTELMRLDLGLVPTRIATRHTAALYCGRPMTLTARSDTTGWRLTAHDDTGVVAVEMEASVQ